MDFQRIAAVLFDVDGTLYRQGRLRALMALELATLPLTSPGKAFARVAALKAFRAGMERLRGGGEADPAAVQLARAAAASGLTVAEVKIVVEEWMMRRPLKYLHFCRQPGLDGLLDRLDATGRRAGVLSDYPAHAKLEALGLGGRFSPVLSSTDPEVGAFKPSARGFLRACEIWKLSPSVVLYVGDRADVDAAGAAAAGMPCVIVGPLRARSIASRHYDVVPSFERLSRAFDPR